MNPDSTPRSQMGPLARRSKWTVGGAIASLALVLATGVANPAGAAAQSPGDHASASVRADGKGRCEDRSAAQGLVVRGDKDCDGNIDLERYAGPAVSVPAGGFASSTAWCPDGYEAISGGYTSTQSPFITPGAAYKVEGSPEGWTVYGTNSNTVPGLIVAYVYCDAP
ncbi:hypothetical protein ACFVW9_14980 [Streptomyces sp. NPDC058217]|uniref:hypothetical protein n=1 Tax=Streptomyces sp. NPDC058217 TaxID=3346384 RepID=UPI0036EDFB9D